MLLEITLGEMISIKLIRALIKLEIITPVKTKINELRVNEFKIKKMTNIKHPPKTQKIMFW